MNNWKTYGNPFLPKGTEGFRHEYKYLCRDWQLQILRSRLRGIIRPDPHVSTSGSYEIRSIYFDDMDDRAFQENEAGVDRREKFRIRIYNRDPSFISLESKEKQGGKVRKRAVQISMEEFRQVVQGSGAALSSAPPLLKRLHVLRLTGLMRPKVIISYERTPYVCAAGNTRITFDRMISVSTRIDGFFDRDLPERPVLPGGWQLLEVKFDEFLPSYLRDALYNESLTQSTFSKYYLGRLALL